MVVTPDEWYRNMTLSRKDHRAWHFYDNAESRGRIARDLFNWIHMAVMLQSPVYAAHIPLVTCMIFMHYRAGVWYEYVNTKQNPADVLSREAWKDPVVRHKLASGLWHAGHSIPPWDLFTGSLSAVSEYLVALGVDTS